jgi:hypothetical protein
MDRAHADFLMRLARARSKHVRLVLLTNATKEQLLQVVEICNNILNNKVFLSGKQIKKLVPHQDFMKKLAATKTIEYARKLLIDYSGPWLESLFTPFLNAIV